jgi:hypothetical protein
LGCCSVPIDIPIAVLLYDDGFVSIMVAITVFLEDNRLVIAVSVPVVVRADSHTHRSNSDTDFLCSGRQCNAAQAHYGNDPQCKSTDH